MKNTNKIRTYKDGVAIITGGASGIGKALGDTLAAMGCEVVLADIQIELVENAAVEICAKGGKATAVKLDVTDSEAVEKLVQDTYERCGRLDYLFNNAGIVIFGEACDFTIQDWDKTIDINFKGVAYGTNAAYNIMIKQGFGHIVNTASIAGLNPWPYEISYTATKHAVVGLTGSLRAEAKQYGIQASVLCPGAIDTPMMNGAGKHGRWIKDYPDKVKRDLMYQISPYPVDKFVKTVLKKVAKNKAIIVVPARYKSVWWLNRLHPGIGILFARYMLMGMKYQLEKSSAS